MPRGFNEAEKEKIKNALIESGEELFKTFGIKKTNIKDLTDKAGIAQGSFYNFFPSKEVLYFAILEREEKQIKQKVVEQLSTPEAGSADLLKNVLIRSFHAINEYPLTSRLFTSNDYDYMIRKLPDDVIEEHANEDMFDLSPLITAWKEKGYIKQSLKEEVISSALRALFLMTTHKREIGEEAFDETVEFLAEAIADRVFKNGGENDDQR
ncbi:TetR/AcrR family transcriptional regulator [Evansella halocellulosilytica]|uniref:TetR/AcrR family transcriptional regulator n=1 Tax=Evansella halocellulosilytica TaxID=2011013 RepID=UPI000BB77F47|nr:TetR/AcrR family transcriptional regulator [Evansella halocellulosilytica]